MNRAEKAGLISSLVLVISFVMALVTHDRSWIVAAGAIVPAGGSAGLIWVASVQRRRAVRLQLQLQRRENRWQVLWPGGPG